MSRSAFSLLFIVVAFFSCHEEAENPNGILTLEAFSELKVENYSLNSSKIRNYIGILAEEDAVSLVMDRQTKKYYAESNPFIWINRLGVHDRADTLLKIIRNAEYYGFNKSMFRVVQIEKDIERIRNLDVISEDINLVMARLEYNLTRAYLRYSAGQHYGLVNPDYLYNSLEKYNVDSVTVRYRQLCDLRVKRPDSRFYTMAVSKAFNDSVSEFMTEIQPSGDLFKLLVRRLNSSKLTRVEMHKIVCNIERCRWKLKSLSNIGDYSKHVVVNIPSFCLRAIDNGKIQTMRVGCGTTEYKTPMLASRITRMDINPQWIVPKSIAKGFVNNYTYMHKMDMFVYDKKNGKLPPESVSYNKVMSGKQYIIQAGGPKNSLGRIIFRFDNNFSVFLHDTSSPWVFGRNWRAVSHGCIRVERPFDLALFMLNDKNEELAEKLKYSMTVRLVNDKDSSVRHKVDRKRLVNSLEVKPSIPLLITYYTFYHDDSGRLAEYDDVYGYDEVLITKLAPFIR